MFCESSGEGGGDPGTLFGNILRTIKYKGHQTKQHKGLPTFLLIRYSHSILADAESVLLPMGNTMMLFVQSTEKDQLHWLRL
jgi:hypothetical protein